MQLWEPAGSVVVVELLRSEVLVVLELSEVALLLQVALMEDTDQDLSLPSTVLYVRTY